MIIGDSEDPPPNVPPEERPTIDPPAYTADEVITQVEGLKSPVPAPPVTTPPEGRPTLRLTKEQQAEINAKLFAHEQGRLSSMLDRLDAILPTLATKGELAALREESRGGIGMAIAASNGVAEVAGKIVGAVDRLRGDCERWLFGDTHRKGISQEVGLTRVRMDSLFEMVDKLVKAQQAERHPNGNGLEGDGEPNGRTGTQD